MSSFLPSRRIRENFKNEQGNGLSINFWTFLLNWWSVLFGIYLFYIENNLSFCPSSL